MANQNKFFASKPWFRKRNPNTNAEVPSFSEVHYFNYNSVASYLGFKFYFPLADEADIKKIIKKTTAFENFINRNEALFVFTDIEKKRSAYVDYKTLIDDSQLTTEWHNFTQEISEDTEFCLNCMSLAMHQTLVKKFKNTTEDAEQIQGYNCYVSNVRVRICNVEPVLTLKNLKTNYYGKLVSVRGTVIKVGTRKLACSYILFTCKLCSGTQVVKQIDLELTEPKKCPTKGCRVQSKFQPSYSFSYTMTYDQQLLKIQELLQDSQGDNGRIPRTYECDLSDDLVNCCVPGDDVTVTGILKRRTAMDFAKSKNKQAVIFNFYLDVVSVVNNKNESQAGQILFNTMDYYAITKIHEEPNLFRYLVQSLCPSIYGNEIVKAGLLLAIFGGTDDSKFTNRSLSHILMIGDPGIGKSQILQACSVTAPRGVYVCGKASTTSGLTATVTRDAGEYALEAGALVLADQGICCIDEFDKIPAQHEGLLEAMEQLSISLAKASIICTLPARTTILAAANPAGGHYNRGKSIAENLKIKSAMLSRFDLIFIMLDQPEFDAMIPQHVLRMHTDQKTRNTFKRSASKGSSENVTARQTLRERLRVYPDEEIDPLEPQLLRKYIAYAQKYVKPILCQEANDVLKNFYFELRKKYQDGNSTPVTVRQLYSLIRLTQARAKSELREEATKQDAVDVIEIMEYCLAPLYETDSNEIDSKAVRSSQNLKNTSRNQINKFLSLVQRSANLEEKRLFSLEELTDFCCNAGISDDKIAKTIDTLNHQGYFLKKGNDMYQLVSTSAI